MNRRPPYKPSSHPLRLQAELEWLTSSPDLLLPPPGLSRPPQLQTASPNLLDVAAYQPHWRLGEHFENLVFQYLRSEADVFDIKRNIQVKSEKKTLGEFDFLIQLAQQWLHLEVALKLYLLDGDGSSLAHYIGTRRDDCLAQKWHHMLNHQLKLTQRPEAKRQLAELGIEQPLSSALWIKGWLFYHPLRPTPRCQPEQINPAHLKGWWLTQSELELIKAPGSVYMLVRKPDWLLPASMLETDPIEFDRLREAISGQARAHLVLILRQTDGGWIERSRGFVVADDWSGSHGTKKAAYATFP
ncbi:DUF1853 family protein [Marinobacterium sp. D7]|uniref:DUF1853 family protein n=1 Tax=Marinobacterium ramblicola TaxID=2849041 RepID=UPI001C2CCFC2|nr:DUF1853 family protein [Marinobacterium ramblicola]